MRKQLIAANWKLNGSSAFCREFVQHCAALPGDADVLVCPPAVYIAELAKQIEKAGVAISVGAQNVASENSGAYTGEISATMLAEAGASYAIVGHSERRSLFGETDADVLAKCQRLLEAALTPVLCVGESLQTREAGEAEAFVEGQLQAVLGQLSGLQAGQIVLAYEPVWAIGTGVSATAGQAQQMHAAIREGAGQWLNANELRILYGGSIKAANARLLR